MMSTSYPHKGGMLPQVLPPGRPMSGGGPNRSKYMPQSMHSSVLGPNRRVSPAGPMMGLQPDMGMKGGMNNGAPGNQFADLTQPDQNAKQKNIEVYAQSLAQQHRAAYGQDLTFVGNGPRPGTHVLQDHQIQLMLLEQQNRKRLLMARQEQDNQQGVIDVSGFPLPPQRTRAGGSSPNPADQMKRDTPKLGQQEIPGSPMREGIMGQQRGSPAPNMNFDPSLAPPGMPPQFYQQNMPGPNGNPFMRPPSSHPQLPSFNGGRQITPAQMEAMRNGQMQQNGWRGGPQPGMMPGGQQIVGPMGQNPQQRQQMPPSPASTNEPPRPEPSPSVSNQAPPTSNQGNKANPKKKLTKGNKKPANRKGGNAGAMKRRVEPTISKDHSSRDNKQLRSRFMALRKRHGF